MRNARYMDKERKIVVDNSLILCHFDFACTMYILVRGKSLKTKLQSAVAL